jgi:copper transport protein
VLACLSIPVFSGHTRSQQPAWLIFAADLTHLAVAAIWVGGLLGLLMLLMLLGRLPTNPAGARKLAAVVVRFSGFALVSVLLLTVSGAVMAFLILDEPAQLLSGSYGRMLLVKVGLVVAAVTVALWNRMCLISHLAASCGAEWSTLRRTLAYEFLLLVVVALVTAVLTGTDPGHSH